MKYSLTALLGALTFVGCGADSSNQEPQLANANTSELIYQRTFSVEEDWSGYAGDGCNLFWSNVDVNDPNRFTYNSAENRLETFKVYKDSFGDNWMEIEPQYAIPTWARVPVYKISQDDVSDLKAPQKGYQTITWNITLKHKETGDLIPAVYTRIIPIYEVLDLRPRTYFMNSNLSFQYQGKNCSYNLSVHVSVTG